MPVLNEQQKQELTGLLNKAIGDEMEARGISQEKWFDAFLAKLDGDPRRKYNIGGAGAGNGASENLLNRIGKIYVASKQAQAEKLKALTVGTDDDGGYIVPTEFVPELIQELTDQQSIRSLVRVLPVGRQSGSVPVLLSGTILINISETGSYKPASDGNPQPTFGKVAYNISKWGGIIPVSDELGEDAFTDIGRIIMDVFSEAARVTENIQCLTGTGGSSNAPNPTGIFTASAGYQNVTPAATPGYDDFAKTFYKLGAAYRKQGSWLMNTDALAFAAMVKDTNGRPLFVPDPRELGEFTILGKRVDVFDEIPTTIASGKTSIGFGFWKSAYYLFDRRQLTVLSTNLGGDSFTTGTVETRVDERFDGRPADKKAAVILKDVLVA